MTTAKVSQSCYKYSLIIYVIDQNGMHTYTHMYVYISTYTLYICLYIFYGVGDETQCLEHGRQVLYLDPLLISVLPHCF